MQNLHQHSTYCDGKDAPEDVVLAAIARGFDAIGFSGHSYMPFSDSPSMNPERTEKYKAEIRRLKRKYEDAIQVFCGIEAEMYSRADYADFDYAIGSSHYLKLGDAYVGFDRDKDTVQRVIDRYFGGSGLKFAREYYRQLAALPAFGRFDIVGHFDLVAKHCERAHFFDADSSAYRRAAIEAAEALAGKIPLFEVNTGAIARGYRTTPYPMPFLIRELHRLGFGAVITSDCHDVRFLDTGFDDAAELLKACGYTEQYVLTQNGFVPVKI